MMTEKMYAFLQEYPLKTIAIGVLEGHAHSEQISYELFVQMMLEFEQTGVLTAVKSSGRAARPPHLAYKYRIQREKLVADVHVDLQRHELIFHPAIQLDAYYRLSPHIWEQDRPYLNKINEYLQINGLPKETVPAPERSYELIQNEKWITEEGGDELLHRAGLWDAMKIIPISDPLMFALNPFTISQKEHYHLIVENKTTYEGLLPALSDTGFTTLIYGCGKKIIKSIEHFDRQLPLKNVRHSFMYFGDLDREGMTIWYLLREKVDAELAIPFYRACLAYEPATGKEYQRQHSAAIEAFTSYFSAEEGSRMIKLLEDGQYYPQEVLKSSVLQHIWRETDWKATK